MPVHVGTCYFRYNTAALGKQLAYALSKNLFIALIPLGIYISSPLPAPNVIKLRNVTLSGFKQIRRLAE